MASKKPTRKISILIGGFVAGLLNEVSTHFFDEALFDETLVIYLVSLAIAYFVPDAEPVKPSDQDDIEIEVDDV